MTMNPPDAFDAAASRDRLLPWRKVKDLTGISRTTAWRLQNAGDFPRPVVISPGRVGWRESDVAAWKAALAPRRAASRAAQPRLFAPEVEPAPLRKPSAPSPPAAEAQAGVSKRSRKKRPSTANQMSFDF